MNTKRISGYWIVLSAFTLFLNSCATRYVPNVIQTPMLSQQGEVSLGLHTGTSGVDPQFAVAFTDRYAFMINASFADREYEYEDDSSPTNYHKHNYFDVAGGYYISPGIGTRYETFAGIGRGRTRAFDKTWGQPTIDSRFTRYFIHYTMGASTDNFEGCGSLRLVFLNFDDRSVGNGFYFEPALTGKFGSPIVKFVLQLGFSLQVNAGLNPIPYNPFLISIGLDVKIQPKKNHVTAFL